MKIREFGKLFLVTLFIVGISPALAGATAVVSIPNVSLGVGGSTTVPIMINGTGSLNGANIVLSYNSSIVHVTQIVKGPSWTLETFQSIDNVGGIAREVVLGFTPLSGNVKFADVTLEAEASAGSSPLNLTVVSLQNITGEVPRTVQNGTFTITTLITPLASISNPQITTGNFWINNTWVNPQDNDFDHVWFRYSNGTTLQNVSTPTNYLNKTWQPHYTQNLSAQTVDTTGNINSTMVWFNATIPNNPPVLASVGDKVINANQTLTIALSASDVDGDTLTYSTNRTDLFSDFNTATGRGNWTPSFTQTGIYSVNFAVSDGFGGIANETIQVTVNSVPPSVVNTSANPSAILMQDSGNADFAHMSTTFNVTVIGATQVRIDLSAIGRAADQNMINITDNIWSIKTNATTGLGNQSLRVNASDAFGNFNNSVSINLSVVKNGDVDGNGIVNLDDAIYLANHVLLVPGFETINGLASDVDGDGNINLNDAIYLANHVLLVPGYELLY